MSKELSEQEIKKSVADFYKNVATGKEQSQIKPKDLSKAIGYSEEELASVPKEANLGLGCGNPQEKAQPQTGEMVVDLGCGKGMDVFIASKKVGDTGHVIGIDMLSDMIEKARIISTRRNFPNVEFRLGEIEHLPVADSTADLVLSNCVINLSTNKPQVYREIFRILKPGGRIGISDITLDMMLPSSVTEDPKMYGT